jgi:hypothetical protein
VAVVAVMLIDVGPAAVGGDAKVIGLGVGAVVSVAVVPVVTDLTKRPR